ncbi:MAG: TRAP transporter small permease [Phascolarctobacterium sp.]|nr:MAG: TRAP transporter small permease [Phascolarctobacterium sp.]
MKSFINVYDKIVALLTNVVGVIAGALILLTGFMIVYEIVARNIFNSPTEWVMEISTYCIIIAGFLGMGVAYAGKKHIHVDIILTHLSAKTRCYIEVLTSIAGIYFSFIFTVEAWKMMQLSLEYNNCAPTTLSTPLWIPQLSLPVGMFVLLLQIIGTLLHDISKIAANNFEGEVK